MKKLLGLVLIAASVLAAPTAAQCSTFDVDAQLDTSGTFQTVTWSVTGSTPMAPTFLVVGETPGTTTLTVLGDTLDLGLAHPFAVVPAGITDPTGALSSSFDVPPDLGLTLHAQAVSLGIQFGQGKPTVDFCESNVDDVVL